MSHIQPLGLAGQQSDAYLKLRAMTGAPIRVTFSPATGTEVKVAGLLERVVVTGMLVDLEHPPMGLELGSVVSLEILTRDALIRCETTVSEVDPSRHLYLHLPLSVEAVQRRRHPRADINLEATLRSALYTEAVPIHLINISAGGAAYSSHLPFEPGSRVQLYMSTDTLAPAEITAHVVRCTQIDEGVWAVGVAFDLLNPAQEAKVVQYVSTIVNPVR